MAVSGKPPAGEFSHLYAAWQLTDNTYRKWSMVGWQSYRCLFSNPPHNISLHHIWPLLCNWLGLRDFVSTLPACYSHNGYEKEVFSTVLIHVCLNGSHVWGAAWALKLLRHTRPNRQHVWAQGLARVTWAWFPQDGLQWSLQQPEEQRNDKNILWFPSRTCPPQPCPFPCSDACFQEGQASCMMEWWMRGGRGGRDWKEKTDRERWIGMGWWSNARSDFGESVVCLFFSQAVRESDNRVTMQLLHR